ncbi:glycine cleavage system protein GcvH [Eubacteriales bacterium OttesenSCG-928-N13]|nr:glycine cleavage system protein GcvH [Eubacteriales bacterium OttesenSCG-928-N13]
MNIPANLKYSKSHEWVEFLTDTCARVGITDFAQSQMGDIVYINLPLEGADVVCGESFTDIESVKAVSDVFSPVSGCVSNVNGALDDAPEQMNQSPYEAWICEVQGISATEELMDAAAYQAFIEEQ